MRKVRCYWNLHRKCWSVQDAATRKVIGHATQVLLRDVTFTVSAAGRERVLREQRKNVHAFACGTLEGADWLDYATLLDPYRMGWTRGDTAYARYAREHGQRVGYNPYRAGHFVRDGIEDYQAARVDTAPMALLRRVNAARPDLHIFEPCNMTEAQSAAATV